MAATYNFTIDCGATFYRKLTWTNPDQTPIDTTGYSAKMQIRKSPDDTVLVSLDSTQIDSDSTISISGDGEIEINISAQDSAIITSNVGVYDLIVISPEDVITRLIQGKVTFSHEVTSIND